MSSCLSEGIVHMIPDDKIKNCSCGDYRGELPQVVLDGKSENYFPQNCFDWVEDAALIRSGDIVWRFTVHFSTELLAKNEQGEIVWMDGRSAPFSDCWEGEYLGDTRPNEFLIVDKICLNTAQKQSCKIVLEDVVPLTEKDFYNLAEILGETWPEQQGLRLVNGSVEATQKI